MNLYDKEPIIVNSNPPFRVNLSKRISVKSVPVWVVIQNIQWSGLLFIKYLGRANSANVEEYSGLRIQRGVIFVSLQANIQSSLFIAI